MDAVRTLEVPSPLTGAVTEVAADDGAPVATGSAVLVIESMKMEHEIRAPADGVVRAVGVAVGDQVTEGQVLFSIEAGEPGAPGPEAAPDAAADAGEARDDLNHVLERRRATLDEARPEAVGRRHESGRRTARENVADLCDAGSFSEVGGLALAAQRSRRTEEELIERTPADGMVCGIGGVNGEALGLEDARTVVLAYDYTVLAGTQGIRNHRKADRMLDLAERQRLPVVLFAEGGGGRPGDTEKSELFLLDVPTFGSFARLSGLVPRIGIASGSCFAGNAALLGCCDVVIATPEASIGMGGPAMIEGGGLGAVAAEDVGPVARLEPAGVIDVVAGDEAEAVAIARQVLGCFQGQLPSGEGTDHADQRRLRALVPEDPKRVHDVRAVIDVMADPGSVVELRRAYGVGVVTALARIEGRPVGVIANDPRHLSGALDSESSEKAARFVQLCDGFGVPVVSLVDTPGFMVGPESEATGMVRRCSRLFTAAATVSVPWVCVVLRRAYGLGAMAMAGGGMHAPALTVAWPTGEFGAMGIEGAVRLALRRELEEIDDPDERERRVREVSATVREQSGAVNVAAHFEIDDVIDPAETRERIVAALGAAGTGPSWREGRRRTMVDTW